MVRFMRCGVSRAKTPSWSCYFAVALFVATGVASADAPVWKVSRGQHELYIGGTIHLLGQDDYPLPPAFERAYAESAQLVFETDMQEVESPGFQQAMMRAMVFDDDTTLRQVLKPETYAQLEDYLGGIGIPVDNFARYKPGMVSFLLSVIEMQRLGLAGTGVDSFYTLRARNDRKRIGELESAEQQLAFIATMGEGQEDALIVYTLQDLERLPEVMQSMKSAWRQGDNRKLEEVALDPWKNDFPEVYQSLLAKRNRAWVPQIESMLTTRDVELVLVGALHLVGEDGVLALLEEQGCRVEQVSDRMP